MFLLIRYIAERCGILYATLHSTMFLLILPDRYIRPDNIIVFTFHNVSINTKSVANLSANRSALHSTMFLLIPILSFYCKSVSGNFTFHNVSINTETLSRIICVSNSFTFHNVSINTAYFLIIYVCIFALHSTMFLLIPVLHIHI